MSASHFLIYLVLEEKFKKLHLAWGMWTGQLGEVTQCHTHVTFVETKTTLPYMYDTDGMTATRTHYVLRLCLLPLTPIPL